MWELWVNNHYKPVFASRVLAEVWAYAISQHFCDICTITLDKEIKFGNAAIKDAYHGN